MPDASRHLNLSGASNFRDLGGYVGKGGRQTRWGHLFRSNHLGELTDDDMAQMNGERDKIAGKLQEKYGWTKEQAERELTDLFDDRR